MGDFLKISRNGEILEILLDHPKANQGTALQGPAAVVLNVLEVLVAEVLERGQHRVGRGLA